MSKKRARRYIHLAQLGETTCLSGFGTVHCQLRTCWFC
nr:MAG TPA: hypothetical protein [Caudoviricetes sp.]